MQKRNVLGGGLLVAAVALVSQFEGFSTKAYQDAGNVWTICYGETKGVKRGDTATRAQCDQQLVKSLIAHNEPLTKLPRELPDNVHLATLDWVYNVGETKATKSTLWKYLQQGAYPQACDEFTKWRFVAGRDCAKDKSCTGVYNRRVIERDLCRGNITVNDALVKLGAQPLNKDGASDK